MLLDSGCAKHLCSDLHEVRECADPPPPVLPHIPPAAVETDIPISAMHSMERAADGGVPSNLNSSQPCDTKDPPEVAMQAEQLLPEAEV